MKYKNLDINLTKLEKQQTITPREKQSFYPRIVNNTNIMFTSTEISSLEKGLKYNLHTKKKNCLTNLALEFTSINMYTYMYICIYNSILSVFVYVI
jgi:hypothetical protein